jgi:hypothetical protein
MDLLDRYLQAVRANLPKSQQEDIIKELAENLRAQIEDQESGLGRPLSEEELAALLKKHGHPIFVAMRYRQTRHLIGSTLFPFYWLTMKIILVITAFGYGVAALVMLAQSNPIFQILGALFNFAGAVLPLFAWVTIAFAVLDLTNAKFHILEKITREANEKFDPRTLPPLSASDSAGDRPIPRTKTAFELFFSVAFLLWWIRVTPIRQLALFVALGPVGLTNKIPFQFGPVWNTIFVPVILLTLLSIAQQIVNLIHPNWIKFYAATRLVNQACTVMLSYVLSRTAEILVLSAGIEDSAKFIEPLRIVNLTLHYVFFFIAFVSLLECFKQIRRLFRVRRNPAMSPAL